MVFFGTGVLPLLFTSTVIPLHAGQPKSHSKPDSTARTYSDLPISVEDSGSPAVDALVVQLVSRRPAPFSTTHFIDTQVSYQTRAVEVAFDKLVAMGTAIFPALITHLRDDRYSYSVQINGWVNLQVGDAIECVLSEGTRNPYEYLARKTSHGNATCPTFRKYLQARQPEKWAEWAKNKTRPEIQSDFLQWCFAKEKEQGFADETQEHEIVGKYEKALTEASKLLPKSLP